jgi:outer membrane cobalamin receptor
MLDDVVVRLPRAEAAGDPTAAATVVDAARFAGEAKDVAALVATAPGVAVSEYGGLGQLATVSIRGSMATGVLVLLDGLPLDGGTAGGSDLASIPRHWVSRLEVIRGAEGAHFGAGALGGVVNVVTRRPEAGAWSAESGAGSFGTFTLAADGGAVAGPWTIFAAGSLDGTQGDFPYLFDPQPSVAGNPLVAEARGNNAARRGGLLLKATRPVDGWRLDLLGQLSGGRRELAGSPYALTPNDWQVDSRAALSARLAGPGPAEGLGLAFRASARVDRLEARLYPSTAAITQDGAGAGLTAEATQDHPGGLLRVALSGSGEAFRSDSAGGSQHARLGGAASASEDLPLLAGRLRLAPALRVEAVGPFSGLSAKLGSSLALGGPTSLRASVGRTFRAPSFAELYLTQGMVSPNPELVPETGVAADAALVVEGPTGLLSLGGFTQLYRDLILYKPATFDRLKPFNAGKALVSGLELEAALAPRPDLLGLSAAAAYTLLASETLQGTADELGKWLPHRARHRLYARVGVEPGPAELHLEAQYVGRQFQDPANAREIPAALVWSAGGSVRLLARHALRLHLEVKNLTDDRTLQDGLGNPLPSRLVMVTLRAGSPPTEGAP